MYSNIKGFVSWETVVGIFNVKLEWAQILKLQYMDVWI